MTTTVVCFGDSLTRGLVSANYVDILAQHLFNDDYFFINEGVNNDYSFNLLLRAGHVIHHNPQIILILIGTNDVIATLSPVKRISGRINKSLPCWPNLPIYEKNLEELLQRFRGETQARIGLASIPVLGEDLESVPNQRVRLFNQVVQQLSRKFGVTYIDIYERQARYLRSIPPARKKPYKASFHLTFELAIRRLFNHETFDSFSKRKGYTILTDGVHMNSIGARLIASEMEYFLRSPE